jgi:hypothetical protein
MKQSKFPEGWDEARVRRVISHYETQAEEEAVAEDEAIYEEPDQTMIGVPTDLVPEIRKLIAKRKTSGPRTPIPAELRRRVLVEAGHRCAIPTCRNIIVDVHHIIPWEQCKKHEYENLIALCPNCHRQAERGEIDRKSLRMYKANLRFAIEKYSQFEMDVLFELYKAGNNQGLPFPIYLSLLIKRLLDSGFVQIIDTKGIKMWKGSVRLDPVPLIITKEGREFVKSLSVEDIGY